MRVVDGHQGRKQLRLGIFEVIVQNAFDIFGRETGHPSSGLRPPVRQLCELAWRRPQALLAD